MKFHQPRRRVINIEHALFRSRTKNQMKTFDASQLKSKLVETCDDGVIELLRYQKARNFTCLQFVTS